MRKHAISFADCEKMTRDSFAEECDINRIVEAYQRTGLINHVPRLQPQYGDAPEMSFYEAACISARAASAIEEGLPEGSDENVDSEGAEAASEEPDDKPAAAKAAESAPQDAAPGE